MGKTKNSESLEQMGAKCKNAHSQLVRRSETEKLYKSMAYFLSEYCFIPISVYNSFDFPWKRS